MLPGFARIVPLLVQFSAAGCCLAWALAGPLPNALSNPPKPDTTSYGPIRINPNGIHSFTRLKDGGIEFPFSAGEKVTFSVDLCGGSVQAGDQARVLLLYTVTGGQVYQSNHDKDVDQFIKTPKGERSPKVYDPGYSSKKVTLQIKPNIPASSQITVEPFMLDTCPADYKPMPCNTGRQLSSYSDRHHRHHHRR